MNNLVYILDYTRFVYWCLPIALRQSKTLAYLNALIAPIVALYNDFIKFKNLSFYKMNHNSQLCYLEAAVNDSFDTYLRRIYIKNLECEESIYL